jgi:hypothetical protein
MRTLGNQAAQVTGYAREMRAGVGYELKNHATGNTADLVARHGTIGPDVLDISHLTQDFGVFTYDPGFMAADRRSARFRRRSPSASKMQL